MARTNLSKVYMIQGPSGPVQAKRPSDEVLRQLRELPHSERFGMAITLAEAGFTLDAAVDVNGWDYWKTMDARRGYGYTWIPAGHMPNILIAPGLWVPREGTEEGLRYDAEHPPVGAILVPKSEQDDPNFREPIVVQPPPPPPEGQAVFGPPIEYGEFASSYSVGASNTVPAGTHATKDGAEYVYVILGTIGTLFYRKLWVPVGR